MIEVLIAELRDEGRPLTIAAADEIERLQGEVATIRKQANEAIHGLRLMWKEDLQTARVKIEQLQAEIERWITAEHDVSDAYLRLRQKLNAFDTPTAPTLEQISQVTEGKVDELLAEIERLRAELEWWQMAQKNEYGAWLQRYSLYEQAIQRAETAERELAELKARLPYDGKSTPYRPSDWYSTKIYRRSSEEEEY